MRLCYLVAAVGLGLPLLAVPVFGQSQSGASTVTDTAEQTSTTPSAAPAQQTNVPPLQLHDLPPEPHTLTPEEQAAQKAVQMRMALSRLANAEANWGPPESAPGMSIDLKETGRKTMPNGTELTYQIAGKGFTPDMQLTLLRWPLNSGVIKVMSGIVVNADGLAVCGIAALGPSAPSDAHPAPSSEAPSCTKAMKPGAPITITTTAAKGEAIRVALVAPDHKHGAAVSYVPFPIVGQNNGCSIQVILGSKNADLVLIKGEGFKQDKTYALGTESFGQKHPLTATINAQGRFVAALTPWVPGHDTGNTVVYYQSDTCTPTVDFTWGKDTYKPQ